MSGYGDEILSTEGLELERYTNENGEFCIDATLGDIASRPTETIRFKRGDEVQVRQANGDYLIGEIIGPPTFNELTPSELVDHFKAMADDPSRTMVINVKKVGIGASALPQLSRQIIFVDPAETSLFQERLTDFVHKFDGPDAEIDFEEEIFPEPSDLGIDEPA